MKKEIIRDPLVTLAIKPHQIHCSIVAKNGRTRKITVLESYTKAFDNLACEKLILFNPTSIEKIIASFLKKHAAQNYFVSLTLCGPQMHEDYMPVDHQTHSLSALLEQKNSHLYQYERLYPFDNHQSVFYVCGIAHPIILQYKLLAQRLKLKLLTITTETMALLQLYKYFYGSAFRPSQLAIDMMRHNNMIEQFFTTDTIHRLIDIKNNHTIDSTNILTACGLFVSERFS